MLRKQIVFKMVQSFYFGVFRKIGSSFKRAPLKNIHENYK